MIFWIALAFCSLLLIVGLFSSTVVFPRKDGYVYGEFVALSIAFPLVLFMVAFGIISCCAMGNAGRGVLVGDNQVELSALATKDGVEGAGSGAFFVSSFYIESSSYFSYITRQEDESYHLSEVGSWQAEIYEDEEDKPYLSEQRWDWYADFWLPWNVKDTTWYAFHVPKGSVTTDLYSVTP